MSGDAAFPPGILKPNELVLLHVPRPSRSDNLKTLKVIAIIAAFGFAIALFALHARGSGSGILAGLGITIGPYLFVLWLRSAKTHFVLTDERALGFVGDTVADDFPWKDSECPVLLERGQPVPDAIASKDQNRALSRNVMLKLRTNRPFSWKKYLLGRHGRMLPIPNRLNGPNSLDVLETSRRAWEAAQ